MAVIVEHVESGEKYVLIGAGFGAFKTSKPSDFFGNWAPVEESGHVTMVAVCDSQGTIGWIKSGELKVVEVESKSPAAIIG